MSALSIVRLLFWFRELLTVSLEINPLFFGSVLHLFRRGSNLMFKQNKPSNPTSAPKHSRRFWETGSGRPQSWKPAPHVSAMMAPKRRRMGLRPHNGEELQLDHVPTVSNTKSKNGEAAVPPQTDAKLALPNSQRQARSGASRGERALSRASWQVKAGKSQRTGAHVPNQPTTQPGGGGAACREFPKSWLPKRTLF